MTNCKNKNKTKTKIWKSNFDRSSRSNNRREILLINMLQKGIGFPTTHGKFNYTNWIKY